MNENWIVGYRNTTNFMAKITYVEVQINAEWTNYPTEIHRMIAQMILRRPSLDYPFRGEILHKLGRLILTTNYDTVIEDCVPNERISMSHIEASKYIDRDVLHGLKTLGPGPLFQNPLKHLLIHVHGRYFDIGRDHGFCFTPNEYSDADTLLSFNSFMVKIVTNTSLVFIGAKGTVEDSHFSQLWNNVRVKSQIHYILHRKQDQEGIESMAQSILDKYKVTIIPICYGDTHDDLWTFLSECCVHTN